MIDELYCLQFTVGKKKTVKGYYERTTFKF